MKVIRIKDGPWGLVSLMLAAVLMFSGGLWGVWACLLQPLATAWTTQNWVAIPAVLDEVSIQSTTGTWYPPAREGKIDPESRIASMPYGQVSLQVRYHYTVGDRVYESTRYGLHQILADGDRVRQAAALMYRRQAVTAWVNPAAPDQALIDRQLHWEILLFGLAAVAMMVFGVLLLGSGLSVLLAMYWPNGWLKIKRRLR